MVNSEKVWPAQACLVSVALLGAASLIACGSGSAGERPDGFGAVSVALSEVACDALEAATVIDSIRIAFDPSTSPLATLAFTRAELDAHCGETSGEPLAEFSDVPVGGYTASAEAYRADDVLIGTGSEAFAVFHADLTTVTIILSPVEGRGDVNVGIGIEGDWSTVESGD